MKKVVIIGAGPAGLTAGYELLKRSKDYEVLIIEASNDIGGISKTVNYHNNRMDIGGHRFFSKDSRVIDFWLNILPLQGKASFDDRKLKRNSKTVKGGPDPEKEDRVMLIRRRVSRIYYLKKFFDYPISLKFDTFKNLGLKNTFVSGVSYLKSLVYKRKEKSLEDFYINRFGKELYSTFFESYTEKVWGRHPSNIMADWGSQRVKGVSILELIKNAFHLNKEKETSLIEEFYYPKYGPGMLWEMVAHDFQEMGGKIIKNSEVIGVNFSGKKVKSILVNGRGTEKVIPVDILISSMPIKDLILGFKGKVPKDILKIAKGLPYRDFITVGVLVDKMKLINNTNIKTLGNIIPDCWIYVQEKNVKMGRIQIFNNWSPYMVNKPNDTVWIGLEYFCNENDELWNMSEKEFIKFAIDELDSMDVISKNDVLDSHVEKIKKAYPAYFDTYQDIDKIITYLNEFNNLYCIGRNGQHRYNNMDHSMLTAFYTVDNILDGVVEKDNIWNVNVEGEYHENKK